MNDNEAELFLIIVGLVIGIGFIVIGGHWLITACGIINLWCAGVLTGAKAARKNWRRNENTNVRSG